MYRPVRIDVGRRLLGYSALVLLQDDGLREGAPYEAQAFAGVDLERGPYDALTHRRAWRRALREVGGRLFPERAEVV